MQCNRAIRNVLCLVWFSATQPNYCSISPCGVFRMLKGCLFPLTGLAGGWQGGGEGDKKRGEISYPGNSSTGRGSPAPLPPPPPFLTQAPAGHFVLPHSGESKSVQWAFTAHSPVLGGREDAR